MQREAVVETDHQMFAHRLDRAHRPSGQSLETLGLRPDHQLAFQCGAQHGGRAKDRVAFRHRLRLLDQVWRSDENLGSHLTHRRHLWRPDGEPRIAVVQALPAAVAAVLLWLVR